MRLLYRFLLGAVIVIVAAFVFKLLVGSSVVALWNTAGPVAAAEQHLIVTSVLVMLIIVVPVLAALYIIAWKYRADGPQHDRYEADTRHTPWKEVLLWVAPLTIVVILSIIGWNGAHALDPYAPIASTAKPIEVQVVALRWKWLFLYPEQGIATVNELAFPVNTPVHFDLTADGPISSFWIPQLGSQIYAMAAMQTQLNLLANTTGEFVGKDTEINGDGYSGMTFKAKSMTPDDFAAWVASVKNSSTTLDEPAYAALAEPSTDDPPAYYSSFEDGLFNTIMMMYMMPMGSSTMASGTMKMSQGMQMPGMQMPAGMHM